jgi:hypothetical protein
MHLIQIRGVSSCRPARLIGASLVVALPVLAGCGSGTPNVTAGGGKAQFGYPRAVQFSECMRTHGVPGFPDPERVGNGIALRIPGTSGVKLDSPAIKSAQAACKRFLPNGGAPPKPLSAAEQQRFIRFAQCIRTHGVPSMPDPVFAGGGAQIRLGGPGVNPRSPAFQAAQKACQSLLPIPKFGGPPGG